MRVCIWNINFIVLSTAFTNQDHWIIGNFFERSALNMCFDKDIRDIKYSLIINYQYIKIYTKIRKIFRSKIKFLNTCVS